MENVISEYRVIETDDGFRIEIKGDKEKLRPFVNGAWGPGGGPWRGGPWHGGPWHGGHGPGGWGRRGFGFRRGFRDHMPPWWGGWDREPEEEEKPGAG